MQELREVHKAAKRDRNVHLAYKINAVILLGDGWSVDEVVEALLLDHETLRSYVEKYKHGGISELAETHYKGSASKLTAEQIHQLCAELDAQIYCTTKEICAYVMGAFGIRYTESGMADLLHRLDYVYKKPKLVPGNPSEEEQEIFITQYIEFMANKKDDELVFFADAVHPTHNAQSAHGWIKKGKVQELETNSGRCRLNIHGAMNAETYETTTVITEGSVNGDTTIDLLKSLETLYYWAATIYVILDNAKYHYSLPVLEYLKHSKVKLVFLPTYSPELNLIERLWGFFKKKVLHNMHYKKYAEFKGDCINFFKEQHKYSDEIHSLMGEGLEVFGTG